MMLKYNITMLFEIFTVMKFNVVIFGVMSLCSLINTNILEVTALPLSLEWRKHVPPKCWYPITRLHDHEQLYCLLTFTGATFDTF
jgi:hypothetical protein